MYTARLITKDGATREFILGHPQQYDTGEWYLNIWPVNDRYLGAAGDET